MQLREIPNGERVKLLAVDGGCSLQCRLAAMGLVPGMEVTVISNIPRRPIIVESYGARLTLCQKMASRIQVLKANGIKALPTSNGNGQCRAAARSTAPGMPCRRRICRLREMAVNQSGTIRSVKARGELGRRIRDMGLIPNTQITVVGRAPLKDPVALRLRDFTLSLRNNEADFITVEVAGGACDEDVEHCPCR
jgi:ferrous iron transport protein A